jgi:3-oxoacyl-[acyl-carrier protein] reductase
MKLSGRSAIVTGASRGLGRAIAEGFVRAGANVLLVSRSDELLHQAQRELTPVVTRPGQGVYIMSGDVSSEASCLAIVKHAEEVMPNLSILVNNAGVYGPMGYMEDVEWTKWVEAIQINLFGTALMCRAAIPRMRAAGYGKIINLSGGGATAPLPRISAYAASKAAVVRLTETLSEELRGAHVDVNAIAPGPLNTRLLEEVLAAGPDKVGKEFYERSLKQRDEGGVSFEKGVRLAIFLASSASDGISGRLLSAIWDDWPALAARKEELSKSEIYTLRRIVPEDRGKSW